MSRILAAAIIWAVAWTGLTAEPASARARPAAPAVHTYAAARHIRHATRHHLRRHRRHHHPRAVNRVLSEGGPVPRPAAPHRTERRAALPGGNQLRTHLGGRTWMSLPPRSPAGLTAMRLGRIELQDAGDPFRLEGRVISGRGPPRRVLPTLLPAAPLGGSSSIPRPASRPLGPQPPAALAARLPACPPVPPSAMAAPRPRGGDPGRAFAVSPPRSQESGFGHSHACRPEGATACIDLPSSGEPT